jgi:hypothetical protein
MRRSEALPRNYGDCGATCAHSASVRSLGYRNSLRSCRARFSFVHIGDLRRPSTLGANHNRFKSTKLFPDGNLDSFQADRCAFVNSNSSNSSPWTRLGGRVDADLAFPSKSCQ